VESNPTNLACMTSNRNYIIRRYDIKKGISFYTGIVVHLAAAQRNVH